MECVFERNQKTLFRWVLALRVAVAMAFVPSAASAASWVNIPLGKQVFIDMYRPGNT